MNLNEAIIHAEEVANDISNCQECREQHVQLAEWLKELKGIKEKDIKTEVSLIFSQGKLINKKNY